MEQQLDYQEGPYTEDDMKEERYAQLPRRIRMDLESNTNRQMLAVDAYTRACLATGSLDKAKEAYNSNLQKQFI